MPGETSPKIITLAKEKLWTNLLYEFNEEDSCNITQFQNNTRSVPNINTVTYNFLTEVNKLWSDHLFKLVIQNKFTVWISMYSLITITLVSCKYDSKTHWMMPTLLGDTKIYYNVNINHYTLLKHYHKYHKT